MSHRAETVYVLTLRAEGPATDVVQRLRRALKFLLRACRLRCLSIEKRHDAWTTVGAAAGRVVERRGRTGHDKPYH